MEYPIVLPCAEVKTGNIHYHLCIHHKFSCFVLFGHKVLLAALYVVHVILPNAGATSTSAEFLLFSFRVIVCQLEMVWMCSLNSNKLTKSLKFGQREILIIVFSLHLHNHEKQPNLILF